MKAKLKDGLHKTPNALIFVRYNKAQYGFKIKPKGISEEQKRIEIQQILKATDEYCKNIYLKSLKQ